MLSGFIWLNTQSTAGWPNDNAVDLCVEDVPFEPRPGHRLS
jgi:hypothetical protein